MKIDFGDGCVGGVRRDGMIGRVGYRVGGMAERVGD